MLFCPGMEAGFQAPATTIRLKNIREGMEDYAYLQMIADRFGRSAADKSCGGDSPMPRRRRQPMDWLGDLEPPLAFAG